MQPFTGVKLHQYLGHVNGQEISLILDTGTTAIFVDRKLVQPEDLRTPMCNTDHLRGLPYFVNGARLI